MSQPTRAIIFDCFGVFYADPVWSYMRRSSTPPAVATALHELDDQAAWGKITKHQFNERAGALLKQPPETIEQQFFHGLARNQPLLDYAQRLRQDHKLALLSNIGADMMDGFFTPTERQAYFDVVILSGEEGLAKPDPAIFALACQRLGVRPAETIFIDDMANNCAGARSAGLTAIQYHDFEQMKRELEAVITNAENSREP